MKLLLALPPQRVIYRPTIDLPLGVLSIAGYLRAQNWDGEVEIYDGCLSGRIRTHDGETIFGDLPDEIANKIESYQPDIIGISNMYSSQYSEAEKFAEIAKRISPEIITVMGGPHASSFPLESFRNDNVDFVVMGEGEERLHQLLVSLQKNEKPRVQGVIGDEEDMSNLRPNKKAPIRFIEPLDGLPFPAYDMIEVDRYFYLHSRGYSPRPRQFGERSVTILTSRGCPHQCVFCSIQVTMGYKWRHHSPEYLKNHIEHLVDTYDIDYIHFQDDNFTHDPDRYDQILDMLLTLRKPLKWDTPNGVRGDTWTFDRVKKTKKAGCQYLIVAIESGVQRVVTEVIKKNLDLSQVDDLMQYCKAEKLRLYAFYVVGLPGETEQDIKDTFNYALERFDKYDVLPTVNTAVPLPGTELHDIVMSNDFLDKSTKYERNSITTDEFNPELIDGLYNKYLFELFMLALKKSILSPIQAVSYARLILGYRWFMLGIFKRAGLGLMDKISVARPLPKH